MFIVRTLLIVSLLAIPTSANAMWGLFRTTQIDTTKCQGTSKKAGKVIPKWQPELGGKNTRKAWKTLIDVGTDGCQAILDHVTAGGAGLESADLADMGALFVASKTEPFASSARSWLLNNDAKINLELFAALEPQMLQLTAEEAAAVSSVDDAKARNAALTVLIGYHSEGTMTSTMGIPYWKETAWWGATKAPAQHHIDAVAHIVEAGDTDTRKMTADFISRLFTEGNANQDAWAPTLEGFVHLDGDDQDAANLAARGLAAKGVDGLDGIVDKLIEAGNPKTLDFLVQGLDQRLGAGRGDKANVAQLERVAAGAKGKAAGTAKKLAKKYAKKIK